jgi:hypothetical protein
MLRSADRHCDSYLTNPNSSDESLFLAVLEYGDQFDVEERVKVLTRLLPHVSYSTMPLKFLYEHVENNQRVANVPIMAEVLHDAYKRLVLFEMRNLNFKFNPKPRSGLHHLPFASDELTDLFS